MHILDRNDRKNLSDIASKINDTNYIDETALPSYNNKLSLVRWLFEKRLYSILSFLPKDKKSLILDFGCGTGILLKELSKKYDTVYGADINIQIAEQFLKNRGIGNVILFNNSDDKNYILPIKEKTLDVIICADVLEHVTNLDNILDKLIKLLNDDGLLIISGPTENILYKFGRTILRYKGDYHLRNIYDIRGIVSNNKKLEFVEKKAIFPIFNLFTIYVFKKINNIRGMRNE